MDYKTFYKNVTDWGDIRGMYQESDAVNQAAKALEEVGEFLVAEQDKKLAITDTQLETAIGDLKDAIGDTVVCLIHAFNFVNLYEQHGYMEDGVLKNVFNPDKNHQRPPQITIMLASSLICGGHYGSAITIMTYIAEGLGYPIEECYQKAWDAIKDRKGMFINKKYVKWDNLNPSQRQELSERLEGHIKLNS
jgi:hypothetical protein